MDSKFLSTRGLRTATAFCVLTLGAGMPAMADDTDIFFGQNAAEGQASNPNVLMILDSSGSMVSAVPGDPQNRDRMEVLQDVANDFIQNLDNVNIGLMKYDIRLGAGDSYTDGGMVVHEMVPVEGNRNSLSAEIANTFHVGNTPLQETYLESAYYWMGAPALFGVGSWEGFISGDGRYWARPRPSTPDAYIPGTTTYDSPIIGTCQRNYSVYITDGVPTTDNNGTALITALLNDPTYTEHVSRACTNPDGFTGGGECLDELAEFLFANDFNDTLPGKQNVVSHFIGFALDLPFLQRAADSGGGAYYTANDADALRNALSAILNNVADDVNGFTAPAVTVNDFDRTTHIDQLFFTVFQPSDNYLWPGNVKKYKYRANEQGDGLSIIGQDGEIAVNPATGFFYDGRDQLGNVDPNVPTAFSYWSAVPDGANVESGGASGEFTLGRKILTNLGNSLTPISRDNQPMRDALINRPVPFTPGDTIPWPSTANDQVVDRWLDWAAGLDAYDANSNGSFTDARQSMGDPLHSKPVVVTYGGTSSSPETVLYVATNEGYLHAISGETGQELFAFMPKELWENIPFMAENPKLGLNNRRYGLDGPVVAWKNDGGDGVVNSGDQVILYVGMRRGGSAYYAVDVTNPSAPTMLWQFDASDHPAMGQSWSTPVRTKLNFGTTDSPNKKDVLIFAAGYDPAQDNKSTVSDDSFGNAVYIVDALTGALLYSISNAGANLVIPQMKNAIPSTVRPLDLDLDGTVDRMYFTDIVGRVFRIDVHNEDSFDITGGMIAELGGTAGGGAKANRRFFYAPDVTLGTDNGRSFLTVTLSSGHRADPLETRIDDYLFGIRDYKPFETIGEENDDYDFGITLNTLTTLSATGNVVVPPGSDGFKYAITDTGEKSLARSRVFDNKAYYTTYKPGNPPSGNPCAPAVGSGALYTIDLTTGTLVRDVLQKAGIPPEVTFLFGDPGDDDQTWDTCFGPHCNNTPEPPEPQNCDQSTGDCEYEESQNTGTTIQCQTGAEACDAGGRVRPTRTYWRQLDETG